MIASRPSARTAGGHRRMALQEAVRFVRAGGHPLRDAGALGLETAMPPVGEDDLGEQLFTALHDGDAVGGRSLASLFDGPVRTPMERIGALWLHRDDGIAIEHLATSICQNLVAQLRALLPDPPSLAPLCVGGCLAGDTHLLPSLMAATTLTECGWRALDLGSCTGQTVLTSAIARHPPLLVWHSISVVADINGTVRELRTLAHELGRVPLVVGGCATADLNLGSIVNLHPVGSMAELASFPRGVASTARRRAR